MNIKKSIKVVFFAALFSCAAVLADTDNNSTENPEAEVSAIEQILIVLGLLPESEKDEDSEANRGDRGCHGVGCTGKINK